MKSAAQRASASRSLKRHSVLSRLLREHRYHQQAARGVLKALLPDSGTDIKGDMRSHAESAGSFGLLQSSQETSTT